jgi:hypothetical protein
LQENGCHPVFVDDQNNLLTGIVAGWPAGSTPGLVSTEDPDIGWDFLYNEGEVISIAQDSIGGLFIGLQSDVIMEWGIRYSGDYGQTWSSLNSGLHWHSYVSDIEINGKNYVFNLLEHHIRDSIYRSVNPIVSINENEIQVVGNPGIELYPNPCNDYINIKFKESFDHLQIKIFNCFGQLMLSQSNNNTGGSLLTTLNIRDYPSGTYIIKVWNESHQFSKVVVKH